MISSTGPDSLKLLHVERAEHLVDADDKPALLPKVGQVDRQ